ncbi:3'-5' exonuclease [Poseidonibacter antarcticus]|uniref:3'-5' exonuclease n=1 Tax=Poseidonibacter antarcticus TaxID=2478538 RepID=UPI000EF4AB7D|nr:3'-5' exonuclease [Poseidonibacter antarcticus]
MEVVLVVLVVCYLIWYYFIRKKPNNTASKKTYSDRDSKKIYRKNQADSFIVLDIETTGLKQETCKIIEIGAIKINNINDKEHQTFHTMIKIDNKLPKKIKDLTGITDSDLEDGITLHEALVSFSEFAKDNVIVAHNAPFDLGFIRHNMKQEGIEFSISKAIDTLELSRDVFPHLKSYKLGALADYIGIDKGNAHRAIDDAKVTLLLYTTCLELLKKK